jgi:hypothetical protein
VAVQANPQGAQPGAGYSYRVRNLAATAQYFTWGSNSGVASLAPAAGVPVPNTIGMLGASVEAFELPVNAWFIASSATGFEFTFGQGA